MHGIMESTPTVRVWVREAQAGDRDAFDRLVAHYRDRLENVIQRRLGAYLRQRIEVGDVVQETWLKALQSVGSFHEQGDDSFFHWVRGIAENLLLYWARQHQRTVLLQSGDHVDDGGTSPSKRLRREERFDRLQDALSRLSTEHREVVLLARVEGLSMQEIAERLDRTPAAVKQLLWRAMQKLATGFSDTESLHLPQRDLKFRNDPDGK